MFRANPMRRTPTFVVLLPAALLLWPVPPASAGNQSACGLETGTLAPVNIAAFPDVLARTYALFRPEDCDGCASTGAIVPTTVQFLLKYVFGSCPPPYTTSVELSLVAATGDPECLVPDPDQVLCGPVVYSITQRTTNSENHTLALPGGCCIDEPVFISVRFLDFPCGDSQPSLRGLYEQCRSCEQYLSVVGSEDIRDWCIPGGSLAAWFQLNSDCCTVVQSPGDSWGSLKSTYR